MISLCPHLIHDYFGKVEEIFKTYRPQIIKQVEYQDISEGLTFRGVISPKQHDQIELMESKKEQMEKAVTTIQKRIWGLENFVMVLMDENLNPWLAEELFQSYTRYLVPHIKKQRSLGKCDCPAESSYLASLNKKWIMMLRKMDSWIFEVGTSIGFLNQTLYPTGSLLSFISDRLPLPEKQSISSSDLQQYKEIVCSSPNFDNSHFQSSVTVLEVAEREELGNNFKDGKNAGKADHHHLVSSSSMNSMFSLSNPNQRQLIKSKREYASGRKNDFCIGVDWPDETENIDLAIDNKTNLLASDRSMCGSSNSTSRMSLNNVNNNNAHVEICSIDDDDNNASLSAEAYLTEIGADNCNHGGSLRKMIVNGSYSALNSDAVSNNSIEKSVVKNTSIESFSVESGLAKPISDLSIETNPPFESKSTGSSGNYHMVSTPTIKHFMKFNSPNSESNEVNSFRQCTADADLFKTKSMENISAEFNKSMKPHSNKSNHKGSKSMESFLTDYDETANSNFEDLFSKRIESYFAESKISSSPNRKFSSSNPVNSSVQYNKAENTSNIDSPMEMKKITSKSEERYNNIRSPIRSNSTESLSVESNMAQISTTCGPIESKSMESFSSDFPLNKDKDTENNFRNSTENCFKDSHMIEFNSAENNLLESFQNKSNLMECKSEEHSVVKSNIRGNNPNEQYSTEFDIDIAKIKSTESNEEPNCKLSTDDTLTPNRHEMKDYNYARKPSYPILKASSERKIISSVPKEISKTLWYSDAKEAKLGTSISASSNSSTAIHTVGTSQLTNALDLATSAKILDTEICFDHDPYIDTLFKDEEDEDVFKLLSGSQSLEFLTALDTTEASFIPSELEWDWDYDTVELDIATPKIEMAEAETQTCNLLSSMTDMTVRVITEPLTSASSNNEIQHAGTDQVFESNDYKQSKKFASRTSLGSVSSLSSSSSRNPRSSTPLLSRANKMKTVSSQSSAVNVTRSQSQSSRQTNKTPSALADDAARSRRNSKTLTTKSVTSTSAADKIKTPEPTGNGSTKEKEATPKKATTVRSFLKSKLLPSTTVKKQVKTPPPSFNSADKERLSPANYSSQQWAIEWASRQDKKRNNNKS